MNKQTLYDKCLSLVEERIARIQSAIDESRKASFDESKSSMGDKYETTKSMLQYEQEKMSGQLSEVLKMKKALTQIGCKKATQAVESGSLVITSGPIFYITISLGKVEIAGKDVFVISPVSPIGQQLISKKIKEKIMFNKLEISVEEIF